MAKNMTRDDLVAAERSRLSYSHHGQLRIAVGYPNSYHVGMSSLAYQWVVELTTRHPGIGVERFFADRCCLGNSFDTNTPLAHFEAVAFSCSFELDAVNILSCLHAAGIDIHAQRRGQNDPLIIVGGALASINSLPLSPAVDVFCLGAAERMWPTLLERLLGSPSKSSLLEELAHQDGFFVPRFHLDDDGRPRGRCRRLERKSVAQSLAEDIPASHVITPHTEYRSMALLEMSRGCPEKCRYCWVSHNFGELKCYPVEALLHRIDELAGLEKRIGLVATAVGDHPELATILNYCNRKGVEVSLSSLRIPAMTPEILGPLAASGARSITIAPETGTDALRRSLNKQITNDHILAAVQNAQDAGIPGLKMYFIVGLPGEDDHDLDGIVDLVRRSHSIIRDAGRRRGRLGSMHIGLNVLIPKPFTPYGREAMIDADSARSTIKRIGQGLAGLPNLSFDKPSYRAAVFQAFLARSDQRAFNVLMEAANGGSLGALYKKNRTLFDESTVCPIDEKPIWQFIGTAPLSSSPNSNQD